MCKSATFIAFLSSSASRSAGDLHNDVIVWLKLPLSSDFSSAIRSCSNIIAIMGRYSEGSLTLTLTLTLPTQPTLLTPTNLINPKVGNLWNIERSEYRAVPIIAYDTTYNVTILSVNHHQCNYFSV